MSEKPNKAVDNRQPDGTFGPGNLANPDGRPKGKTLKEYAREWYQSMTDEEKKAYVEKIEAKKPGFAWQMAEGNPSNEVDLKQDTTVRVISIDE